MPFNGETLAAVRRAGAAFFAAAFGFPTFAGAFFAAAFGLAFATGFFAGAVFFFASGLVGMRRA
jgi:hypothetical protein